MRANGMRIAFGSPVVPDVYKTCWICAGSLTRGAICAAGALTICSTGVTFGSSQPCPNPELRRQGVFHRQKRRQGFGVDDGAAALGMAQHVQELLALRTRVDRYEDRADDGRAHHCLDEFRMIAHHHGKSRAVCTLRSASAAAMLLPLRQRSA